MKLNQAFEDKPERMDDAVQTFVDFFSISLWTGVREFSREDMK